MARLASNADDRPPAMLGGGERKRLIKHLYVARDATEHIAGIIDTARENRILSDEPLCVLITGDTGTGKSAFLRNYASRTPMRRSASGNLIQPLVSIALDSAVTMIGAAQMILRELQDPSDGKGKLKDVTGRIRKLGKDEQVEAYLIDEFQHLIDTGSKTVSKVGDWIKQLAKSTNTPFIMVGMPDALRVVDGNPQFSGITPHRETLGMFRFEKDGERRIFRSFLAQVDAKLPFERVAGLGDPAIATALFMATGGNMRMLMTLIRQAAGHAVDRKVAAIGMTDLAYGYSQVEAISPLQDNPFTAEGIFIAGATGMKDAA